MASTTSEILTERQRLIVCEELIPILIEETKTLRDENERLRATLEEIIKRARYSDDYQMALDGIENEAKDALMEEN